VGTNVPTPSFGPTGFSIPSQQSILAGVIADLQGIFGGDLNLSSTNTATLNTPQGQLATTTASIVGDVDATFLQYTNLVDPALSSGRMQDAIARIYFIERLPAEPSVLEIQCNGLTGVNIPVGALIQDGAQNIYTCTRSGQISTSGNITVPFSCNTVGPVPVPATVTIYQAITGWDSVQVVSGVSGQNTETPQQFELRRQQSVAGNSIGSLPSILGAVLSVPGVLDAYVTENPTNGTVTIQGQVLIPNSLYVAVFGGSAAAVARAIWSKKSPGCAYNGNTTIVVQDTNAGYSPPLPQYSVTFETPPALPIIFNISLASNLLTPANAGVLIQAAIQNAFAGGDGGPRARIGSTIYASRFYAPVIALGSWVQIRSITIGSPNLPAAIFTGSIAGSAGGTSLGQTMTVTALSTGTIGVGQVLTDASGSLTAGTTVLSQLSGSVGGTGTYSVSQAQNLASETIKTVNPVQTSIVVNINQEPTVVAPDIFINTS
jgi:Baseplate J-like protein